MTDSTLITDDYDFEGEIVQEWDGMETNFRFLVHKVLKEKCRSTDDKMMDILNRANPKIVFKEDISSFRIHPDSMDILALLIKNYA